MRRDRPRSLAPTLDRVLRTVAPATTLARVQERWQTVAGRAIAAEAEPAGERDGVVTVACRSAVWAQELDLLAPDLLRRLNASLAEVGEAPPLRGLRFVTRDPPGTP